MVEECSICSEINGILHNNHKEEYAQLVKNKENIIWQNEYFAVIPSIGPLNEGHILIVPKRHVISFHYLSIDEKMHLNKLKERIRKYNEHIFKLKTEFFEHGTGIKNNYCGSCIAHAHMHALPIEISIHKYLYQLNMLEVNEDKIFEKDTFVDNGYLYLEDIYGKSWFNNCDLYPSQILRKYYAVYSLNTEEWDWRIYPNFSKVGAVISKYRSFSSF